jgi:hypothetical protein
LEGRYSFSGERKKSQGWIERKTREGKRRGKEERKRGRGREGG